MQITNLGLVTTTGHSPQQPITTSSWPFTKQSYQINWKTDSVETTKLMKDYTQLLNFGI